ncbi:MAG: SulP family inorganic anion transporter [Amylibacter sp.]
MSDMNNHSGAFRKLLRQYAPGLETLSRYERTWLSHDFGAGLSVAAIALPIGIAYAELAGVPVVVGMYSAIFPLLAYALFGSSRQLMVGPDAATCIMVAGSIGHLAGGDPEKYLALMVLLTLMTGTLFIIGGIAKLGFIANFLSQPVLVGFLNGVALLIIVGQFPKLFGYTSYTSGFFPKLLEFFNIMNHFEAVHQPTMILGIGLFVLLITLQRFAAKVPAALVVVITGIIAVVVFDLQEYDIAVLGVVPAGLPTFHFAVFDFEVYGELVGDAAAVMLISFTSGVLTAKSFASRNHYDIDANQEMIAFGAANILTGLAQGFPVTGADSRTAVNNAMGGKSQLVGIIAAVTMLIVLFFLTGPLSYVPITGLAVVIIVAAFGLIGFTALYDLFRISQRELMLSLGTTFGILVLGALQGVFLSLILTFAWLIYVGSRPHVTILGRTTKGLGPKGFHSVLDYPDAETYPGLIIYRFESDLLFYNIDYFKQSLLEAIDEEETPVEWVIIDASPINILDLTAVQKIDVLHKELAARGILLARARAKRSRARFFSGGWGKQRDETQKERDFPTISDAIKAFNNRPKKSVAQD